MIVDCDLRRGVLHKSFGAKRDHGLSNLLLEEGILDEYLSKDDQSGLFYITCGKSVPNPTDLLSSKQFSDLLNELSTRFDIVLLDSPPLIPVADTAIIAPNCSMVLMVIKQQFVERFELEQSTKILNQVGVSISGAVINDLIFSRSGYYAYGYYSRYYRRYENAYLNTDKEEIPRWKRIFNWLFL